MRVTDGMRAAALRLFGALPPRVRRVLIRAGATTYTVGCVAVIRRGEEVLLLEQPHHAELGLPGGFLDRHETPAACLRRELREELGVQVAVEGEPAAVLIDGQARRVDLVFVVDTGQLELRSTSPEVQALHWRRPGEIPAWSAAARAVAAAEQAGRRRP